MMNKKDLKLLASLARAKIKRTYPNYHGMSYMPCPYCLGEDNLACEHCHGTGEIVHKE